MAAKFTLVCFLCACTAVSASNDPRLKRQATDIPTSSTSPTSKATGSPTTTTENFDTFLESIFRDLGIVAEDNATVAADVLTSGTIGTQTMGPTTAPVSQSSQVTSTPSQIGSSISYPQEDNVSSLLPEIWSYSTTTTTEKAEPSSVLPSSASAPPDQTEVSFNDENCRVNPVLTDFCILPQQLTDFLGPSATLHDLSDFLLSMEVVHKLTEKCPAGSWCLNSFHAFNHLEEKLAFWSNSSDFTSICWQPLDGCLRSVVDYFTGCDIYPMYDLIAETKKLLCEMKEAPMASRDCVEQTLKALHVSMADFHREDNGVGQDTSESCARREAAMTANYLCARDVCGEYGDLLQQFKPWAWFMEGVPSLEELCIYDNAKCTTQKEEEAKQEAEVKEEQNTEVWGTEEPDHVTTEISQVDDVIHTNTEDMSDDDNSYAMWVTEEIDVSTVLIVGAISVAAIGFFFLVGLVWCLKRRRSRHRVREGVEYMEILPDMDD